MKPKEFMMKYSRILILVLIMVFVSAASLDFLKPSNLLNVARQSSMLLIMSLGMTCAMLLGQGVDMSIGATLSLTSCCRLFTEQCKYWKRTSWDRDRDPDRHVYRSNQRNADSMASSSGVSGYIWSP